jgi:cytoskeletal protein RodZ
MASIGDRLREARTRRGLGFDEAEAATKIRARYLRALEAEQFDLLPGPTFARTFLRTYADFLGLDARLLVEEYRTHHERPDENHEGNFTSVGRGRERPSLALPRPSPLVLMGGGVVALLVFFLILGLVAGEQGPESPEPAPAPTEASDREPGRRGAPARPRPRPRPTSVSLLVAPTEPTYLCVEDGSGQVRYEGTLTGPRRFRGKRLSINLGKRSPRVVVNGRRVPLDPSVAQPIAFELRPRGRRTLVPGQGPCT